MHNAVSYKLCVFKPRDHRKNTLLLAEFQICLKSYDIVERSRRVFLSQLNYRIRTLSRVGIGQTYGLHRTVASSVLASFGKHFYRHTALVDGKIITSRCVLFTVKIVERR